MSRVARSRTRAAAACGWSIHTLQIWSSVASAWAEAQTARRLKSPSRNGRSRAGLRKRRPSIKPRISPWLFIEAILVEVARGRCERSEEHAVIKQAACHQMHNVAVALDHAVHREQAGAEELGLLALAQVPPDHHVDVAGFVLQRDKNHSARGVRPLAAGHQPRRAPRACVRPGAHFLASYPPPFLQVRSDERERVPTEREAEARVIGDDVFAFA